VIDYQRIKEAVTMEAALADYSITPGRGGWAICPMHSDRHPSLKVYKDGYYCFACGSGGDVITFVARMEHATNAQAAAILMARHGLSAQPSYEESRAAIQRREALEAHKALDRWASGARDILCAARRAEGGRYSQWDYYLDWLEDAPAEMRTHGGEEVIKRAKAAAGWDAGADNK